MNRFDRHVRRAHREVGWIGRTPSPHRALPPLLRGQRHQPPGGGSAVGVLTGTSPVGPWTETSLDGVDGVGGVRWTAALGTAPRLGLASFGGAWFASTFEDLRVSGVAGPPEPAR